MTNAKHQSGEPVCEHGSLARCCNVCELDAEVERLRKAVEDWHDRAVTAERHLESLQNRYAQATAEAEAYRAELERLRDVVSEIDASLIDDVLGA